MTAVISRPDTQQKLEILSADAQYDLACACGTTEDGHRKRGSKGKWIYPVTLPNGGTSVLFKTLISKSVKLEESPAYKESIFTYAPNSVGAFQYRKIAEEIIDRAKN